MEKSGTIFDLKRYAIHDGPGIRTTVFFKGCPLNCIWCHNPESRTLEPEEACFRNSHSAASGGDSSRHETVGRKVTVSELMSEIVKDRLFYEQSRGGVTFSGGEPLLQMDFLADVLQDCRKQGIRTAIDTSGYAPASDLEKVSELTDLFMFDLKVMDDVAHREHVGVSNRLILDNLVTLSGLGLPLNIRVPLIPGFTDTSDNLEAIADFLKPLDNVDLISLLPYNRFRKDKLRRFGIDDRLADLEPQTDSELAHAREQLLKYGYRVKIGG